MRTSIDIQVCLAAIILAALFLESRSDVSLTDSIAISIVRHDTTPLALALPITRGLSKQRKRFAYTQLSAGVALLVYCHHNATTYGFPTTTVAELRNPTPIRPTAFADL